jgi:hypothetical protein
MSIYAPSLSGLRAHRRVAFAGGLGLVSPAAGRVFQRDTRAGGAFSRGAGACAIQIAPAVPVSLLEYRLRDAGDPSGAPLQDWTDSRLATAAAPLAAGAGSVTLTLPASGTWYLLDLRANGEYGSIATTAKFGVGEVIAAAGQSLAADFWGTTESGDATTLAGAGTAADPRGTCLAAWDGAALPTAATAWASPADAGPYRSAFAAEFLRLAVAGTGVTCALAGYAYTGTYSAQWLPVAASYNGVGLFAALSSVLQAAGGKFAAFLWCQGHNDARLSGGNGVLNTEAGYKANLATFFAALAASFPAASFKRLLSSIPSITSDAAAKYDVPTIGLIRAGQQDYIAADPLALEVDGLDAAIMTANGGVHPTQAGNVTFARHFYRAFARAIGLDPWGDQGPTFAGAPTRAAGSAQILLPVAQAGGTALVQTGTAASQFTVYPAGTRTGALAITAVDTSSPTRIALTLAAAPADTQALDIWYRLPWDSATAIASGIYDNNTADGVGGNGRQLMLTGAAAAMTAPAPAAATVSGSAATQGTAWNFTYALATPPAYIVLNTAGADEGTRQPIAGASGSIALTPQRYGSYRALIYAAATGGTPLAASAAFTVAASPALPALASPVAQFDVSDPSSVFADAARTTWQATNFGPVQGLADLSGNGWHVAQTTAAKAPALILNRRNGLPGLRFQSASGQFLQNLAGASWMQGLMGGPLTVLAVFELVSDANSSTPYVPVSLAYSGNTTGANSFNVQASTTGTPWVGAGRNPVGNFGSCKDSNASLTQKNVLLKVAGSFSSTASTMSVVVDGDTTLAPKTGITGSLSQAGSVWDSFFLGGQPGSPAFTFDGYLYEVDIWAAAATQTQLQALVSYATSKWGS